MSTSNNSSSCTLEAHFVGQVKYDQDSIGLLEIVLCEGEKLLLPGRVPDTHGHFLPIDVDDLLLEGEA